MIWLAVLGLAAFTLLPLIFVFFRTGQARGRRDSAVALHRAQLVELDRDLADGRVAASEHAAAKLELQRRLLAASATEDLPTTNSSTPALLLATLLLVPAGGLALYLVDGAPGLPAAPLAARVAAEAEQTRQEATLLSQLRQRLAQLDPHSPQAREGYVLLGNIEAGREHWPEAAQAWQTALASGFDATLAVQTAEAMARAAGTVTPDAAALFQHALDTAPADVPWRAAVQERLAAATMEKP